ncbi:MAG: autotransporter-associated beta strand repeat-containing protein [Prevotella sp.]|nr:autotransporter-associated beta strand repeat-containing protein [Prevotella sp.]
MRNLKECILSLLLVLTAVPVLGQRMTDRLDRGLVAVRTDAGVFCTWRVLAEEYYDVKYNIYRDGIKLNGDHPLEVSNFLDTSGGNENSQYTVTAVVRGTEKAHSKVATVWAQNYLEITPDHGDLKSTYVPNDACCADVDGDGELEILLKFDNQSWASADYPKAGYEGEYFIIEVYKLDGRKLWWIDLGPNMADFQNNEQNIIAYDWDEDGRAEAVMRASDGTVIHMADGTTYEIGDPTKNYLAATSTGQWFVHEGQEFLVYMDGATGKPYQVMDYPLKRLEAGETSLDAAWGDGYGHRSTKHFFGAPCLDGRKASIFLARGIYTRHKMVALDVNPDTHELTERWRWTNNTPGSSWYAQGYHNYSIADVDWDGRDEICFGSMVIDDNGHGLSTTGLGHGDAHHVGDFNPYIHGQELYACNEDRPDNNYRDATTSKIYYRQTSSNDDGRAMMGNFSNDYPGCLGRSGHDTAISSVTNEHIPEDIAFDVNFRIYWDGDLLEETFNGTGTRNSTGRIYKPGVGDLLKLEGSLTNNDTKATPCYQGDILGDWREEVIMRTKDNKIRIYTTTIPTDWRIPTLWHDHQYRNAMVWQMCGYNQPPHVSYFLGELEGITQAPPPLTMTGRQEIGNGETIGIGQTRTDTDDQAPVILCEPNDMTVSVADGASPSIFYDNAPTWVQGYDDNEHITTEYFTHTLTGGAFTGAMRLVKQGDGILDLPKVTETYTGPTDVWAGTLRFHGTMQNSRVWLNRFATLVSNGGEFLKGIKMDYGAELCPGEDGIKTDTLTMGFGSRIHFNVSASGTVGCVKARVLSIETKDWQYGPQYSAPVFKFVLTGGFYEGRHLLVDAEKIEGNIDDIVIEGLIGEKASLSHEGGKIYLDVSALRHAADVTWDGGTDSIWDFAGKQNFLLADGTKDFFVTGDRVTFNDEAQQTTVTITEDVKPGFIVFDNTTKDYTLTGDGAIIGIYSITKRGAGNLTINNTNRLTGGVTIEEGTITVSALANAQGAEYGALGSAASLITFKGKGELATKGTIVTTQELALGKGGGIINTTSGSKLTANGAISQIDNSSLTKTGSGTLVIGNTLKADTLIVEQGILQGGEVGNRHQYPSLVILNGGSLKDPDDIYSYSTNAANIVVPEGKTATWILDSRCDYQGKLLGSGELTVNVTSVRCNMQGDWSQFEGTLNFQNKKTGSYDPQLQWNNDKGLGKATVTGTFHNNGKDVTIGTLIDKAVISGNGRTTAKRLVLDISKVKGKISHSYIEVAGTLIVSGSIDISLKSKEMKAGDEVVLWKAGALQTTSGTVVNLPELPEGLYWDTSELLKKEGKLKVTDVPPTGINHVQYSMFNVQSNSWYSLDGRKLNGEPKTKGIYIKNGKKTIIK